ncbi:MAG: hypothetical protein UX31_C0015G0015 [Candidatus Nomurabacteria bacterium GW2011_GWA1_46_11]|uniref:Uncharacterized protein n=1 Tax=Candidatus Nomurabacteria bacterium GW2011_GWA1_46_11 TaxID=1618732 RepID=A0A0G1NMA0_9BACT|nr:MAG: hypothetical protein UW69_C0024G0010 [Microgenomates group bacterium GW2011_GWA2_44_7]KKT77406.1 MAG: hypothetical protein UW73_C0021G0039 [Microgenomates group bacterium GW2011_GWB1_44_8]KKU21689.1 MAG: hypothetical protein UX31_C0015G0015 [Candidatus Nomurabacteria bacterium GW2011_GWA1_46_11]
MVYPPDVLAEKRESRALDYIVPKDTDPSVLVGLLEDRVGKLVQEEDINTKDRRISIILRLFDEVRHLVRTFRITYENTIWKENRLIFRGNGSIGLRIEGYEQDLGENTILKLYSISLARAVFDWKGKNIADFIQKVALIDLCRLTNDMRRAQRISQDEYSLLESKHEQAEEI